MCVFVIPCQRERAMSFDFREKLYPRNTQIPSSLFSSAKHAPGPQGTLGLDILDPKTYYMNGKDFEFDANETITKQFRLDYEHSISETARDHDLGSLAFTSTRKVVQAPNRDNMAKQLFHDAPLIVKSWSRMNYYLRSERGRLKYGDMKTGIDDFYTEWRLLGQAMTNMTPDQRTRSEFTSTFAVGKRIRTPNVWLATGLQAMPGDWLWLIPILESLPTDLSDSSKEIKKTKPLTAGILDRAQLEEDKTVVPRTYLRFEPYITEGSGYVPSVVSKRPIFVGSVFEIIGSNQTNLAEAVPTARQAVFPTADNEDYKKQLVNLQQITVQLFCKN
jgi:hypothetical protein